MKTRKLIAWMLLGMLLAVAWVATRVEAQGPILPLAEPRPDPIIFLPVVTKNATIRLSGLYMAGPANLMQGAPVIEARLRLIHPNGSFDDTTPIFIKVIENKAVPGQFAFHMVLTLDQYGFFDVGDLGAVAISLRAGSSASTGAMRGYMTAGVYVEETSAAGPLFSPYAAWLAEPRPDPVFSLPF